MQSYGYNKVLAFCFILRISLYYQSQIQGSKIEMCRMLGYLGGIALFMALGIMKISGYDFFFATAIINLVCIVLVIVFRLLAKRLNGFWRVWDKRLQKQVCAALYCLSQYTQMPEYEITTTTIDGYGNKSVSTSTTNNTLLWGMVECFFCAALSVLSPFICAFILFCYIQAIVHECRWREQQRAKEELKEKEIARQSARMTLTAPLRNKEQQNIQPNIYQQNQISYQPTYPMQPQKEAQSNENAQIRDAFKQFLVEQEQVSKGGFSSIQQYATQNTSNNGAGPVQYSNIQQLNIKNDAL